MAGGRLVLKALFERKGLLLFVPLCHHVTSLNPVVVNATRLYHTGYASPPYPPIWYISTLRLGGVVSDARILGVAVHAPAPHAGYQRRQLLIGRARAQRPAQVGGRRRRTGT